MQALYKLEEIYELYPTEVDGQIHFVFRNSVAVDEFKPNLDTVMGSPGVLLQYRVLGFMKACAQHGAGELTDEEYALWKSKFPAFLSDFYESLWEQRHCLQGSELPSTVHFEQLVLVVTTLVTTTSVRRLSGGRTKVYPPHFAISSF